MSDPFKLRLTWAQPEDLVAHFFSQANFEGVDVADQIATWVNAGGSAVAPMAGATPTPATAPMRALARSIIAEIEVKLAANPELDYEAFLNALPNSQTVTTPDINTFHGAWLGRAAGCLLGKPVEKTQRDGIRAILQSSDRWPLTEYFTGVGVPAEVLIKHPWNKQSKINCLQENIDGMAEDDDMNYPLIALMTLETYGRNFNTHHIADQWLKLLPAGRVYTAERVVYRNLLEGTSPSEVGAIANPFKEWIGAFIRADLYGWVNPGNPKLAAQMAYRDAYLSHRRNGLYGAAMSAAMNAVAMVSKDINEVIDAGMAVLPPDSAIFKACALARELGNSDMEYELALDALYAHVDGMHWVHTVNNAALGVLGLSRSKGEFSKAITLTVMGGWDTDSIGATVGSICGAMFGAENIDPQWSTPIDNRLASSIPGCNQLLLTDLAARTRVLVLAMNSIVPRPLHLPSTSDWDNAKIIAGPKILADRQKWREDLKTWRTESAQRFHYSDAVYNDPEIEENPSYNVAVIWLWDELLFDFTTQEFTPEKLIADSQKFGGFDGIILWHAYPVIGIDSRNQFDFYNDVPGLAQLIFKLQNTGVKVYLNYNPWDKWTKREDETDQVAIAHLLERFNFDGVFLDTMKSADTDFMAPILKVKPDVVIGGEGNVQQERICDHIMSWGQRFADSEIPGVVRAKYFEPRHMIHQTRRWNRSHIDELHIAWLNGTGMLIWEVVFGSWVGWNKRDSTMWHEMVTVLRQHHRLTIKGEWEPLTQLALEAEAAHLFASSFSLDSNALITIINKSDQDYQGPLGFGITGFIPACGVGAITITPEKTELINFTYNHMSAEFPVRDNKRQEALVGTPTELKYSYRNRETSLYGEAAFILAWKPLDPYLHQIVTAQISVPVVHGELDRHEVSNQDFFDFMKATGYTPKIANRFLAHWVNGAPRSDQLDSPVVYIDLEDAQAFATWRGCEVPNEWDWQLNAGAIGERASSVWNLTNSMHSNGRTRFLILKGGSEHNLRQSQGSCSESGIWESDWYMDGGVKDSTWVEKLLLMGAGMSRSENIGFRCFQPKRGF